MDSFFEKALIEHWSAERTAKSLYEAKRQASIDRIRGRGGWPGWRYMIEWEELPETERNACIEAAKLEIKRLAEDWMNAMEDHGFVLMTREQEQHYRELVVGQDKGPMERWEDRVRRSSQKDTQNPKKGLRPIYRDKLNELEDRFGAYSIGAVVTACILAIRFLYQSTGLVIGVAIFAGCAVAWIFKGGVENKTKWRERAEYLEEREGSSQ